MYSNRVKTGVFVLEGLNALATSLYFNYLFFHMRAEFGFTNVGNLVLCAVNGLVYAVASWFGGQFAQRQGYFVALRLGFLGMALALLAAASLARSLAGQYAAVITWTLAVSLTWPSMEALTSEQEPQGRLPRLIGIYNVVWASGAAVAYFIGGAMLEKMGRSSIFLAPAGIHLAQLAAVAWLERGLRHRRPEADAGTVVENRARSDRPAHSPVPPATFLKMAWVANPFAYIAINALLPVIPHLAARFELSPMFAGFFCSVWFFSRVLSFVVLWIWTDWHYRFRWLCSAYVAMAGCFTVILLSGNLWVLLAAQVIFGLAAGLIYYSSLFYSMDVGETKGEHGGFHEAAIGVGIFTGPAVGAASLRFFPETPNMNAWAVTGLLAVGLLWLVALRWRPTKQ
jgi:predicted MFS family arabinose efflux permease